MAHKKKSPAKSAKSSKPDSSRTKKAELAKSKFGQSKAGESKSGHGSPVKPAPVTAKTAQPPAKQEGPAPNRPNPTETKPVHKPATERPAMPTLLFYQKPVVLNRETHKALKIRSVPSYAYAAGINSVPLTSNEFASAARQLPILFVPDTNGNPNPVALLGLHRDENLFVDADGRWADAYIPAFIRRYPFVLIQGAKPEELTVGIDAAYPGFNTEVGEPMFGEDGTEGPGLKRAIEFLNAYRIEAQRTQDLAAQLKRLDLLIPQTITVSRKDGTKSTLDGFTVVDEQRLAKLDDKEAVTLLRSGHLAWIYMHLLSLHNIADLSSRLDSRADVKKTA
jgi:SapC